MSVTTTQTILTAIQYKQTAEKWESVFLHAGGDWDDLVIHAIVLGLAPQLHRRFKDWSLKPPRRARTKLFATHKAQAERNTAIYQQLGEFLAICQEKDLSPIALKGIHLAAHYYAEPALRPMSDIDLLFEPAELPTAEEVLVQLGYSGNYKPADMGAGVTKHTSTFRRDPAGETNSTTANPYLSAKNTVTIEPHTSLEESWYGLQVDITPGLRQRTKTVDLLGHTCRVLSLEDLLLHLCLHFCFHLIQGSPSLVQLTDLLAVGQQEAIDWDTFIERATTHKATSFALAGLTLAHQLLDTPIPTPVLDTLRQRTPAPMVKFVDTLSLPYLLDRSQQKPFTTLWGRIQRGYKDRAETARWAVDFSSRFRVWRTLFQPGRSDTGQFILQKVRGNS